MTIKKNKKIKFLQKLVDDLKKENETLVLKEKKINIELEEEKNKPKNGYNKTSKLLDDIEKKQTNYFETLSYVEKELRKYDKRSEKLRKKIARIIREKNE